MFNYLNSGETLGSSSGGGRFWSRLAKDKEVGSQRADPYDFYIGAGLNLTVKTQDLLQESCARFFNVVRYIRRKNIELTQKSFNYF